MPVKFINRRTIGERHDPLRATRLAKLEKRQVRVSDRELTDVELAHAIGLALYTAANRIRTDEQRDLGRMIAISFARSVARVVLM